MSDAVRLSGVTKRYGDQIAVRDLDLAVPAGSVYGFIGPNGSGKTTTIRMVLHIIDPDRGSIEVLGRSGTRAANDDIGYLPEERGLYRKMSAERLLSYFGTLKGMTPRRARSDGLAWLERLGIADAAKKKVEALSKGMAQKVQFIASAISEPALLILDEPFSGLDPVNLDLVRREILRLRDAGTTVIFSTHDMASAEAMCDSIFMICRGDKVLDGTLADIKARYGEDTLRVSCAEGAAPVRALRGIDEIRDLGSHQELHTRRDPGEVLRELAATAAVRHFEIQQPTLHDIFVRIADRPGGANDE